MILYRNSLNTKPKSSLLYFYSEGDTLASGHRYRVLPGDVSIFYDDIYNGTRGTFIVVGHFTFRKYTMFYADVSVSFTNKVCKHDHMIFQVYLRTFFNGLN